MADYEKLFEEKLDLLVAVLSGKPVTWSGTTRAPLRDQIVYPAIESGGTLKTWVGVGGTPDSVVRAARHNLPLMLAIIGGDPKRFAPYVDLFHRALAHFHHEPLPIGAHSPGHVAATDEQAREELWPHHQALMTRIGAERGWPPITRAQFNREAGPNGAICVGSPETVAKKIAGTIQALGLTRFDMKYSSGTLPHELQMSSIELYGTQVAARVSELLDIAGYAAGAFTVEGQK
jgi:alkanesulfonate monooxygenase SsuD/methylene tetrahydromethanopterin reductase-like flavin-dependent oxidoreductase (luciferase family)